MRCDGALLFKELATLRTNAHFFAMSMSSGGADQLRNFQAAGNDLSPLSSLRAPTKLLRVCKKRISTGRAVEGNRFATTNRGFSQVQILLPAP